MLGSPAIASSVVALPRQPQQSTDIVVGPEPAHRSWTVTVIYQIRPSNIAIQNLMMTSKVTAVTPVATMLQSSRLTERGLFRRTCGPVHVMQRKFVDLVDLINHTSTLQTVSRPFPAHIILPGPAGLGRNMPIRTRMIV